MKKNKVVVHLMGRDYTLLTDQSAERVQRLARYVDRRLREVAITTRAGETMVPTLTAMMLAEELFRAQDENVRLKRELAALQPEQKD
ncbi:MAG: cell division protein ZapA [Candidatus Ventricola sp.]